MFGGQGREEKKNLGAKRKGRALTVPHKVQEGARHEIVRIRAEAGLRALVRDDDFQPARKSPGAGSDEIASVIEGVWSSQRTVRCVARNMVRIDESCWSSEQGASPSKLIVC